MVHAERPWIEAVGDKVQEAVEAAPHPVAAWVVIGEDGTITYGSRWALEVFRDILTKAARAL